MDPKALLAPQANVGGIQARLVDHHGLTESDSTNCIRYRPAATSTSSGWVSPGQEALTAHGYDNSCPSTLDTGKQSAIGFTPSSVTDLPLGTSVSLGTIKHYNNPITGNADERYTGTMQVQLPGVQSSPIFSFPWTLWETPNDSNQPDDYVKITVQSPEQIIYLSDGAGGTLPYRMVLSGFASSCTSGTPKSEWWTKERSTTTSQLCAQLTQVRSLEIVKQVQVPAGYNGTVPAFGFDSSTTMTNLDGVPSFWKDDFSLTPTATTAATTGSKSVLVPNQDVTVSEKQTSGWEFVSVVCQGVGVTTSGSSITFDGVEVKKASELPVKCTFVNRPTMKPLTIVKTTSNPTYTQAWTWAIDKSVTPANTVANPAVSPTTFTYAVKVTPAKGQRSDGKYTTNLTIKNDNAFPISNVQLVDTPCVVNEPTFNLAAGQTKTVTLNCSAPAVANGTNTATISWTSPYGQTGNASASANYSFDNATAVPGANASIKVADTFAEFAAKYPNSTVQGTAGVKTFTYDVTHTSPAGQCREYTNTASIVETGQNDSASAKVCNQADLETSKNVISSMDRTYAWSIDKSVDQSEVYVDANGQASADYTVTVTEGAATDSNWSMTGQITVVNPNNYKDAIVNVTDATSIGGSCSVVGGVNALVPRAGQIVLDYSCTWNQKPSSYDGVNTATVHWADQSRPSVYAAPFSAADWNMTEKVKQAVVSDTFPSLADEYSAAERTLVWSQAGKKHEFTYTHVFAGNDLPATGECREVVNTASLNIGGQDSVKTSICAADISLTKSASPATFSAAGDVITYTLTAKNTGPVTLTDVSITDGALGATDAFCAEELEPGETCIVELTYNILQTDVDSGSFYNTATVTGTDPGGNDLTDTDDETVTGRYAPAISLTKTAGVANYDQVGDVITYKFVAKNTGNVTLTNVSIADPLDGLSALVCAQPVTLAPGESFECSATYTVTQADLDAGSVDNTATTVGTPPVGEPVTDTDDETVPAIQSPSIELTKDADVATYDAVGDVITYTFVATNTGNVTLSNVTIADPLPGLSALVCAPVQGSTLAPDATITCTASYTIGQGDLDRGSIYNLATTTGTPPAGEAVTATDDETVTGDKFPAISLTKDADVASYDAVGDVITYTFVATNTGNVSLSNVTISDPLPNLSALTCDPAQPTTLAPGASMECSATYTVTQADLDAGSVDNTATTVGTPPVGEDVTDTDDETVPATQLPAISIVKTADVATYDAVDDVITYTFLVTNTGNVTLTDVQVTDPLEGLSALECTPAMGATLAPQETMECSATYSVTQADLDNGSVENTATTVGTPPVGEDVTDTDDETVPATQSPAIELTKDADVATYDAVGDVITYTFIATNTGNVALSNVTISDPLPNLSALTCDPAQPTTLAPGASIECSASYTVTQADLDNGSVDNTATTVGTPPVGEPVTDTDDETVPATQSPAIELTKDADVATYDAVGDVITYTFVATNTGNVTLSNVTISDPLPGMSELTCVPVQPATLAPGATMTCTAAYAATQADLDAGSVYNLATTEGTPPAGEPVTDTDDETVTAAVEPAILLVKTADVESYDAVGDVITYTFVATNTGNVTLTNVTITDPLPNLSDLTCVPAQPTTLAPGESFECSAIYTVTQADLDNGSVDNTATTTGTPPVGEPVTDTDDETVPATQSPAIDLTKDADVATYDAVGDVITYTFVATNTGNVTLSNVTIADPLSGLSALVCAPVQGSTLAPDATMTCTATYTIGQGDLDRGSIYNLATTEGTPPVGEPVTDTDDETVTAATEPSIMIVKTADVESYDAVGDVITYTFEVTNTGNVTLDDVTVSDPLPGLSALVCTPVQGSSLAPNATMECSATYAVTQADLDAGSVDNTATTVGTPPVGDDVTDTDDETVPASQLPDIDLVKTADVESYDAVGDVITYTFVATNTGNVTLTDVTISDPLEGLSALTCVPAQPTTLAPEASFECSATYTVTQADLDNGSVDNTATTVGTPPVGEPVTDTDDETVPAAQSPAIELTKDADVASYDAVGDVITYTFVATNTGNVTLTDVVITDPLEGLSDLTCVPAQPTTLAPGASFECSATYTVTQADLDAGSVDNTATTEGTPPAGEPVTDTDDETVPASQLPDIDLVKTADVATYVAVGDEITYTFVATNTGNVTLSNVTISDPLEGLSALVCAPVQGSTLTPGATMTCTAAYAATQADLDAGSVYNLATTEGTPPAGEPVTDTDDETVTAAVEPAILLVKTADVESYDAVGDVITYTFVATNTGNVTLTNVTITDPLPNLSDLTCVPAQPTTLAPGESLECSAIYTVTQADLDNGSVDNTATTVGTPPVGEPVTDTDDETVPASQLPDIDLVKTADVESYDAVGDVITYTFVATNTGNVTLTDVVITDPLPGLSALTCDLAQPTTLAPEASIECTATYTVTQADLDNGSVDNTATTTGTPPIGDDVTDSDDETVPATQSPAIELTKDADVASYDAVGDVITYTFVATNTGNVTLTDVVITDPLEGLSDLTCVPAQPTTLVPGASMECSASYSVTQADLDAGSVDNTATTVGTPPVGENVTDSDDETVPGTQSPAIDLTKDADVATYDAVGDVITYTFVATNTGNVTLSNVTITDPLPNLSALTCDPAQPTTLAPGASIECSASYTVTQADLDAGSVDNTATTVGTPPVGDDVTDTDDETVPATQSPAISIVKSADVATYDAVDDVITYTFLVTNTGNVTLTDVQVTDPLEGLSALECTPAMGATLAPQETMECSATYSVTQADLDAGSVDNTATTVGTPPAGDDVTDTDDETVPATQTPAIQIVKSADLTSYDAAGDVVTYTLTVTNTGNVTLSDVSVSDEMLAVDAAACAATLVPGASCELSFEYTVTQADVDAGSIYNLASTTGTPPGENPPVTDEDDETVPGDQFPAIEIIKTADVESVDAVGDVVTYTLTVTNTGNVTLTDVVISDEMLDIENALCAESLAPAEQCSVELEHTVTQADLDAGEIVNVATTTGTPPGDNPPPTDEDDETVVVDQLPAISLDKSADKVQYVVVGEVITYNLLATNTGNVTLTDVVISDEMFDLTDVLCAESLAPGEQCLIELKHTVSQGDIDARFVHNIAVVEGTAPNGDIVTDEDDVLVESPEVLPGSGDIEIIKSANVAGPVRLGDKIVYSFKVTNTGDTTLTDVSVDDPKLKAAGISVTCPVTELAAGQSTTCTASAAYVVTAADVAAGKVLNVATVTAIPPDGKPVTDQSDHQVPARPAPAPKPIVKSGDPTGMGTDTGLILTGVALLLMAGGATAMATRSRRRS
nr:choice-of-anchor K domain-containing protein [Tessaracoccus sp. MC1865]